MKKVLVFLLIGLAVWQFYLKPKAEQPVVAAPLPASNTLPKVDTPAVISFSCDGRIHCSQMTSCEEATFFSRNCPGTKMDGDYDGVPCEQQFCR